VKRSETKTQPGPGLAQAMARGRAGPPSPPLPATARGSEPAHLTSGQAPQRRRQPQLVSAAREMAVMETKLTSPVGLRLPGSPRREAQSMASFLLSEPTAALEAALAVRFFCWFSHDPAQQPDPAGDAAPV